MYLASIQKCINTNPEHITSFIPAKKIITRVGALLTIKSLFSSISSSISYLNTFRPGARKFVQNTNVYSLIKNIKKLIQILHFQVQTISSLYILLYIKGLSNLIWLHISFSLLTLTNNKLIFVISGGSLTTI